MKEQNRRRELFSSFLLFVSISSCSVAVAVVDCGLSLVAHFPLDPPHDPLEFIDELSTTCLSIRPHERLVVGDHVVGRGAEALPDLFSLIPRDREESRRCCAPCRRPRRVGSTPSANAHVPHTRVSVPPRAVSACPTSRCSLRRSCATASPKRERMSSSRARPPWSSAASCRRAAIASSSLPPSSSTIDETPSR